MNASHVDRATLFYRIARELELHLADDESASGGVELFEAYAEQAG